MTDFAGVSVAERAEAPRSGSADPAFLVRSVPLGGGALSQALQGTAAEHGESAVGAAARSWLPARPRTAAEWSERAAQVRATQGLPDWPTALAPAFAATGAAAARLARAANGGVLVTTGQQPGLFGGPTYTWTKAIGALAFADELERATGVPVAPVFWAATDDSDWAEAAVTHLVSTDGLRTVSMPGPATEGVSMTDVPLGDVREALDALRAASGSAASASVLDEVASAYVPHATVGAAYVQLLRALLEPLGIAVLDASHQAFRTAADATLRRALQQAGAVAEQLTARTREIESAGLAPQVDTIDTLSLVFQSRLGASGLTRDRTRERIPLADASRAAREAEVGTLGANVLLRPVLERCMLPTVAYFAGPGEFAYFAQVTPVAQALRVEVPLPLPRWSGELIEHRDLGLLEQLGLDEPVLRDPHAAEGMLARRATPDGVIDALERLRVTVEAQTRAVASAIESADAVVAAEVTAGLQRNLSKRLDRFDRRVTAGVKRREERLMRQVAHLRAALRPLGKSPERVLNLMPALARHGSAVFEAMRAEASLHAQSLIDVPDGATPYVSESDTNRSA